MPSLHPEKSVRKPEFSQGGLHEIYYFLEYLNLIFMNTVKFELFTGSFMVNVNVTDTAS